MYYNANQLEDAKESLLREIQANPYIQDSYLLLGDVYIKMNKPQDAIDMFRKLLSQNKKDAYAMLGLAKAYFAGRDFSSAENTVTQARHIDPSINDIYHLECLLYFQTNMFAEAKNSCEEYIRRVPDDEKANECRDIIAKITK
jgi:tetratricopeptide (TPR) repeat protein